MFEHYFCFINIEDMKDVLSYIEIDENENESIDFSKYIQVFKLNFFQTGSETHKFKHCD
jgi:hypothetical protein